MGTRSTIIKKLKNGLYRSIYCHWDGYLGHNGRILLKNYKDSKKVSKLISLGSLSSLGEEVEAPKGVRHTYDKPHKNTTVAYHRDRGDDLEDICDSESLLKAMQESCSYVYIAGEWYVPFNILDQDVEDSEESVLDIIKTTIIIENEKFVLLEDLESILNK